MVKPSKHRMLMIKDALDQWEAGADYIDVNEGIFVGKEADYLTSACEACTGSH